MMGRFPAMRFLLIMLLLFIAAPAIAQPTLPDVACVADKGVVRLSWVCQYSGLRSVSVLRSYDGVNYITIGKVKKTDAGVQEYTDEAPVAGKNYYKVAVVFGSGVKWSSNRCMAYIPLTGADSLRLAANRPGMPAPADTSVEMVSADKPKTARALTPSRYVTPITHPDTKRQADSAGTRHKQAGSSSNADTVHIAPKDQMEDPNAFAPQKRRIVLTANDDEQAEPTFIISHYIFTDSTSGHVDMLFPEDVGKHHYSVKFYDYKNEMVVDIPKINAATSILDKRNFQQAGTYKFVIRRDVVQLETGYVTVVPNP